MKRRVIYFGFLLVMLATGMAWAQTSSSSSSQSNGKDDFYVKTVYLNKVYPTRYGYVAAYLDSEEQYAQVYLPMSWFNTASGKGQMLFGYNKNYPYMNIYWRNGKFDYVQIFVDENPHAPSWGFMEDTPGLKDKFNLDTLKMKF